MNKSVRITVTNFCLPQRLCSPCRPLTIVNEILQRGSLALHLPLKGPTVEETELPQLWWMDIINVVHLFTFYSAIWENEGSTATGKCAYFGTPVLESHPFGLHNIKRHCRLRGAHLFDQLTLAQSWGLITKPIWSQNAYWFLISGSVTAFKHSWYLWRNAFFFFLSLIIAGLETAAYFSFRAWFH